MAVSNFVNFLSSGIKASNAEFGWQTKGMRKIALLDAASQLATVFSNGRCSPEEYEAGLALLNETDKNLSAGMIMDELYRIINNAKWESDRKRMFEKIRKEYTIG